LKSNKVVAVEITKENVLPMEAWKNNIALKREEETLSNYYSLLGFHELVVEAHSMIMELQNTEVCQDLGLRAKALLKEFQKRTKAQSTGLASAIGQVTKTLEINVERLMALN
jgi:DnaJ-domain-containing protein 1